MLGLKSVQLGQEYTINMDAGVLLRSVKLPVRRRHVIITDVDVQQREGCSMRINHTISTDEGGCTNQSPNQQGRGCTLQDHQNGSGLLVVVFMWQNNT